MRSTVLVVALLTAGCSASLPPQAPSSQPAHGAAAQIELNAVSGTGANGGTAAISARVQDAYGALVADQAVAFTASAGSFSATPVTTNDQGLARTVLTAPAGSALVTASAGTIETLPLQITVQPANSPPPLIPGPAAPVAPDALAVYVNAASQGRLLNCGTGGGLPPCTALTLAAPVRFSISSVPWPIAIRSVQWTAQPDGLAVTTTATVIDHQFTLPGWKTITAIVTTTDGRVASNFVQIEMR